MGCSFFELNEGLKLDTVLKERNFYASRQPYEPLTIIAGIDPSPRVEISEKS